MTSTPASAELIRHAGLRVTDSRRAVVDALESHPHASADELFQQVSARLPQTSLQSVYNALADFVAAGLARQIEPAGRPRLYELRVSDNHHHLVCSQCGKVEDVDCVVGAAPCLHPSETHGFAVEAAEVTFWGVCPDCAASPL
ncbi:MULTISPECIES: Fur family transcriptional regulator [Microbacterium]|uniref:Fur family transcriptional regulator n=1 Tax=Microbacterium marmarense TaxID=3122051 RepID=A0ABU8LW36_9MICO